ncbi:hypothetical protein ACFSKW_04905 [Nonomuraea mangrovi]|uniref:Amino acid permease n=2 Tax=Nonomuraea mangrovi TaxID=2316207 RepID=A0ABW4SMM3_9ACTN
MAGSDPYTVIFLWTNGTGIIGVMVLQALAALSVVAFFWRDRRGFGAGRVPAAPLSAFVLLAVIIVLVVANFELITGATGTVNALLILPVPLVFALSALLPLRIRRRDPSRYVVLTTEEATRA